MDENPYAAPTATSAPPSLANGQSSSIRQEHLKHEASVKSIGLLYLLGAVLLGFAGLASLLSMGSKDDTVHSLTLTIPMLVFGGLLLWLGISLRKLKTGARIPAILMAALGLLGFPIGTLINAYFLYLLCSKKGKTVLSPEYKQVIADTPEMKYRTSKLTWILLILLVAVFVIYIAFVTTRS